MQQQPPMHVTSHALLHMGKRTQLSIPEIRKINEHRAFVELGRHSGAQFRLVWDRQIQKCVVWLVGNKPGRNGEEVLVSVWEETYTLPKPITELSVALKEQARQRFEAIEQPDPAQKCP